MLNDIIKPEHKNFCKLVEKTQCYTIEDTDSDVNAKLPVIAEERDINIITVDKGIINSQTQEKCDYLSYSDCYTNFIELKGKNIEKAYVQINETIDSLKHDESYYKLIMNENVYALIVSPCSQNVPKIVNKKQEKLIKTLYRLNKNKLEDRTHYIKYIKVTKTPKLREKGNRIECSGNAPYKIG